MPCVDIREPFWYLLLLAVINVVIGAMNFRNAKRNMMNAKDNLRSIEVLGHFRKSLKQFWGSEN